MGSQPTLTPTRFVIDPKTLVMYDNETGRQFEYVSESIAEHAGVLDGDRRTLYVLLTIATYRIFNAVEVNEQGTRQLKQYHSLSREWLSLYGPDLANDPAKIRAALSIAMEIDELVNEPIDYRDVDSILTYLRDTIVDIREGEHSQ